MQLNRSPHFMLGVSLVELMIGVAIGLILISGTIAIFGATVNSQSSALKAIRLEQELRAVMDLISRDLRRAGYWGMAGFAARPLGDLKPNAVSGNITLTSSTGTPFAPFGASIVGLSIISGAGFATITGYNSSKSVSATVTRNFSSTSAIGEGKWMIVNPFLDALNGTDVVISGSCIQYAYDAPPYTAGGVNVVDVAADNNERYGFRRISNAGVGVVQMHTGVGVINCASGTGTWANMSSDNVVNITNLTFSQSNYRCVNASTGSDCNPTHTATYVAPATGHVLVWMREVELKLEGQLLADAGVQRTLLENVRLRNDWVTVQ